MGTCWNYCWSCDTSHNYVYACGSEYIYDTCNLIDISDNIYYADSTDLATMTNVFRPDESFSNLIGCPLNGLWKINIIDAWSMDNGCVEEAELALLPVSGYLMTRKPTVVTGSSSSVSYYSASCSGEVVDDGFLPITACGICWDTIPEPNIAGQHTTEGTGKGSFTSTLANLEAGTTYYFRAYATNDLGTAYGETKSFTTLANTLPSVTTVNVTNVTGVSATAGGIITDDEGLPIIEKGVCYSTSATPTIDSATVPAEAGIGNFTCTLNGLSSNTKYYVRAYATNNVCTAYGSTFVFYTDDSTFTCGESTVTDYDGNLYHTVAIGTQCWFKENVKTTHYADGTAIPLVSESNISGATRYYPNGNADNVSVYGYLYNHLAAMRGNPPADNHGICPEGWHVPSNIDWQTLANYLLGRPPYICNFSPSVAYYSKSLAADHSWTTHNGICTIGNNLADNNATDMSLLPAGRYHADIESTLDFQSVGYNHYNPLQGDNNHKIVFASFNATVTHMSGSLTAIMASVRCLRDTPLNDPFLVVITNPAESITESTAVIPYSVSLYSSDTLITRGLCWSTEPNPTLNDNTITNGIANGGTFSATLSSLTGNTVYYVRAYASNSFGTVYGRQRTFTTAP